MPDDDEDMPDADQRPSGRGRCHFLSDDNQGLPVHRLYYFLEMIYCRNERPASCTPIPGVQLPVGRCTPVLNVNLA